MNAFDLARTAYSPAHAPVRSPRATEYELFAQITHRLRNANGAEPKGFRALAGALHENRQLWVRLAADVADAANGLPVELRARIFYLSEFTQHHTSRVLSGEGDAGVLVEINTAVMRGLRGEETKG